MDNTQLGIKLKVKIIRHKTDMPMIMLSGTSLTFVIFSLDGPKNPDWKTLTNDASVSMDVTIATTAKKGCTTKEDSYIKSFETKPLKGGKPAMAAAATANMTVVYGIFLERPPSLFKSVVPVA